MADRKATTYHEIIKVPDNCIAWIYIHSQNGFEYVAPHWHRDLELTYMLSGNADYVVNGHDVRLEAGQLLLINDGSVHSCHMNYECGSDAISIIFPYPFITQFQKRTGSVYFKLTDDKEAYQQIVALFKALYTTLSLKKTDSYYDLDINGILYQISSLLFHHFIDADRPSDAPLSDKNLNRFQEITAYIDAHYAENLSLDTVSRHFNISIEHFSRIFKKNMGITFKNYLTRIRMHQAHKQLIGTDLTLMEISMNNGFPDYRTFIHNFKEAYGITPLKYRKIKENTKNTFSLENQKDLFLKDQDIDI